MPSKDHVHQGTLNQDVAEEAGDHAEAKVEGEQVEHGQVGQIEGLVQRGDQRCVDDREDQVDDVAQLGERHPDVSGEHALEHVSVV